MRSAHAARMQRACSAHAACMLRARPHVRIYVIGMRRRAPPCHLGAMSLTLTLPERSGEECVGRDRACGWARTASLSRRLPSEGGRGARAHHACMRVFCRCHRLLVCMLSGAWTGPYSRVGSDARSGVLRGGRFSSCSWTLIDGGAGDCTSWRGRRAWRARRHAVRGGGKCALGSDN